MEIKIKQNLQTLKEQMARHFLKEYPREACGIITLDGKYIPCKNLSPKPLDSFILDPIALLEHEDNVWGVVHSHPGSNNPIPSERDVASTAFDCYKFIVGFMGKFYIYWYDKKLQSLIYEELEGHHLER